MSTPLSNRPRVRERAELLRVLGHPVRIAIVSTLAPGPKCVSDIQELLDAPQPNVSQHLKALRSAGVVDSYEDGKLRCYYIAMPSAAELVLDFLVAECRVVRCDREDICPPVRPRGTSRTSARCCDAAGGEPNSCDAPRRSRRAPASLDNGELPRRSVPLRKPAPTASRSSSARRSKS